MNKRGLSQIITTTLIILMSALSVVVVYQGVSVIIENNNLNLEPEEGIRIISSEGYTVWDEEEKLLSIQIEIDKITKEMPTGLIFTFNINGNSITKEVFNLPSENGKRTYVFNLSEFGKPEKIKVAFNYNSGPGVAVNYEENLPKGNLSKESNIIPVSNSGGSSSSGGGSSGGSTPITLIKTLIGSGNVNTNGPDAHSQIFTNNTIFLTEDLVPSIIPETISNEYYINFTSGNEINNEYLITSANNNVYSFNQTTFLVADTFIFALGINVTSGDTFNLYKIESQCGDDYCDLYSEDCTSCSTDCGFCNGDSCTQDSECEGDYCTHNQCRSENFYCGDSFCDLNLEDCDSCSIDCGVCQESDFCSNPSECFKVWEFSDTHFDHSYWFSNGDFNWSTTFEGRLQSMDPYFDLGIIAGDIVHSNSDILEFKLFHEILERNNLMNRFIILLGNHDASGSINTTVTEYFLKNMSESGNFSFVNEEGNILFIALGNGCHPHEINVNNYCNYSTYEWFNKTVAENQDKIIIAASHHPPQYLAKSPQPLPYADYDDTFQEHNIDIWIYGHTHVEDFEEHTFNSTKTLFLNSGDWECSTRGCGYTNGKNHSSTRVTLTNNSNNVYIDTISFSNITGDTTPIFGRYAPDEYEYTLSKNFVM